MDAGQEKSPAVHFRPVPFLQLSSLSSVSLPTLTACPVSQYPWSYGGGVPRERHLGLAQRRCWLAKVECSIKSHLEDAPLPGTASSWTP